jgi:hypothetical protein
VHLSAVSPELLTSAGFLGVCAIGGVLFLRVTLLGGSLWPARNGALPARDTRIACALMGALLLGIPVVLLLSQPRGSATDEHPNRELEQLTERVTSLEGDPYLANSLISVDAEIRALRAGVVAEDPNGSSCGPNGAGAQNAATSQGWLPSPQTRCDKLKNAQWTVLFRGYVNAQAAALPAALKALGIDSVVGPAQAAKSPVPASALGMVFDEDAPADLICAIVSRYESTIGWKLESAVTRRTYMSVAKVNISSFAIILGVPFTEFFDGNYHRMTDADWKALCTKPEQQAFEDWFANVASTFKAAQVTQPAR